MGSSARDNTVKEASDGKSHTPIGDRNDKDETQSHDSEVSTGKWRQRRPLEKRGASTVLSG
ncbi:hypothetical protein A2U01_0117162, partial [Trifolium medium]|nr:hypothetical protein [Trifolium medium]